MFDSQSTKNSNNQLPINEFLICPIVFNKIYPVLIFLFSEANNTYTLDSNCTRYKQLAWMLARYLRYKLKYIRRIKQSEL